jgi:hypothetical protein
LYGSNATALVLQNSTSSSRIAQLGSDLAFFNNTYETERMRLTSTGLDAAASLKIESSTGGELILSSSDTAQAVDQFISGLAFKTGDESAPSSVPHYAGIKSIAGDVYGNQTLEFYSGRDRYEAGTNPNMVILGTTTGTDGNVGIGTTTPAHELQVQDSSSNGTIRIGGGSGLDIEHDNSGTTMATIKQLYATTSASAQLRFMGGFTTFHTGTSNTERMRIDSSGNMLFNTTAPDDNGYLSTKKQLLAEGSIVSSRMGTTSSLAQNVTANTYNFTTTAGIGLFTAMGTDPNNAWRAAAIVFSSGATLQIISLGSSNITVGSSGTTVTVQNTSASSQAIGWNMTLLG